MLTPAELEHFWSQHEYYRKELGPSQREGQLLMNTLWLAGFEEAYDLIHSTDGDCFYQDSKIPEFLKMIGAT